VIKRRKHHKNFTHRLYEEVDDREYQRPGESNRGA